MAEKGSWVRKTKQYPVPWITGCVSGFLLCLIPKVSRYHNWSMWSCAYVRMHFLCCWVVFSCVLQPAEPDSHYIQQTATAQGEALWHWWAECLAAEYITDCWLVLLLVGTIVGIWSVARKSQCLHFTLSELSSVGQWCHVCSLWHLRIST